MRTEPHYRAPGTVAVADEKLEREQEVLIGRGSEVISNATTAPAK